MAVTIIGVSFAYFTAATSKGGSGTPTTTNTDSLGKVFLDLKTISNSADIKYPGGKLVNGASVTARVEGAGTFEGTYTINASVDATALGSNSKSTISYKLYKSPSLIDANVTCGNVKTGTTAVEGETSYYYDDCTTNVTGEVIAQGSISGSDLSKVKQISVKDQEYKDLTSAENQVFYYYIVVDYENNTSASQNLDMGKGITAVIGSISDTVSVVKGSTEAEPKEKPTMAQDWVKSNVDKRNVESIEVLSKINIPSDAIKSWDASEAKDGSVMAYYTDTDSNNKYELYIAGDGGVAAPVDSLMLFTDKYISSSFTNVITMDVSKLDTSKVTDMNSMFLGMSSLTSLDLNSFDTSSVTNMSSMFKGMRSLTSLDVNNFDTSNVTNMNGMFWSLESLTSLDVNNFDTSNVTNMNGMFNSMRSLTSLDVSHFDTSKVTNMYGMFYGMSSLTSLDVSGFDTRNVTHMGSMFYDMSSLTSLDVSGFDTSKVTNMEGMFKGMRSLTSLDVSNFKTSNVTNMSYMFYNMKKLTSIDIKKFNTSKVTNMSNMFNGMSSLTSLDFGYYFVTNNVTDMSSMFGSMSNITSLDLRYFDTSKVTNMKFMFDFATNLKSLDLRQADFSKVTSYDLMFRSTSLKTITVKNATAKTFVEARLSESSKTGVTVNTVS